MGRYDDDDVSGAHSSKLFIRVESTVDCRLSTVKSEIFSSQRAIKIDSSDCHKKKKEHKIDCRCPLPAGSLFLREIPIIFVRRKKKKSAFKVDIIMLMTNGNRQSINNKFVSCNCHGPTGPFTVVCIVSIVLTGSGKRNGD